MTAVHKNKVCTFTLRNVLSSAGIVKVWNCYDPATITPSERPWLP